MVKLFFSYSHKDEELRNELDKHLSILKRQGVIDAWHDRCITAGSELDTEINTHLKNANVVLLLISSDFLASTYCYDKEMKFAMGMHESGKAKVIPVILRPCDWHDTPFGKLLATPRDGKPVIKYPTLDEAFLEITNEIKRVAKSISGSTDEHSAPSSEGLKQPNPFNRSSNLRIRKNFSDHVKDQFLDDAFTYMANFFEASLLELKKRNPGIEYRFKRIDSQTFAATVYVAGDLKTECTIFYGGSMFGYSKNINFSYSTFGSNNSYNESLSISDDGYNLYLNALGMGMYGDRSHRGMLTFEGASEYYWELFIKGLQ